VTTFDDVSYSIFLRIIIYFVRVITTSSGSAEKKIQGPHHANPCRQFSRNFRGCLTRGMVSRKQVNNTWQDRIPHNSSAINN
jgi:hypothetical protein